MGWVNHPPLYVGAVSEPVISYEHLAHFSPIVISQFMISAGITFYGFHLHPISIQTVPRTLTNPMLF